MFRVVVLPDTRRRSTVTRYEAGRRVGVSVVATPADVASGAVWGTLARLSREAVERESEPCPTSRGRPR